jgi:hypothetical protein
MTGTVDITPIFELKINNGTTCRSCMGPVVSIKNGNGPHRQPEMLLLRRFQGLAK